ncbi:MAG: prolipoprotein diacylglyceryl transferase [Deltaproteobacteria bacterium]|nr:prolipoprotein diacylglyceryl transferase [Deltaproteobacteria bacterium]
MRPLIPFFDHPRITIPLPFELPTGSDHLTIYGFGVMVALGFLVASRWGIKRADKIGLDGEVINRLVGWMVLSTFVGGHLGYAIMYDPASYFANPIKFLQVWEGLSSFGGIVTSIVVAVVFFKVQKLPLWHYLDLLAKVFVLGWGFGRTGCTLAHDHAGAVTNFWLGRQGICLNGDKSLACHDLGMYEMMWAFSVFGLFMLLDRKQRFSGFYAGLLGILYGPVRFFFDFLRPESTDPRYLGFTAGQHWSVVVFLLGVYIFWSRSRLNEPGKWIAPGSDAPKA